LRLPARLQTSARAVARGPTKRGVPAGHLVHVPGARRRPRLVTRCLTSTLPRSSLCVGQAPVRSERACVTKNIAQKPLGARRKEELPASTLRAETNLPVESRYQASGPTSSQLNLGGLLCSTSVGCFLLSAGASKGARSSLGGSRLRAPRPSRQRGAAACRAPRPSR